MNTRICSTMAGQWLHFRIIVLALACCWVVAEEADGVSELIDEAAERHEQLDGDIQAIGDELEEFASDRYEETTLFLERNNMLHTPCLTALRCPASQCCIRQVRTYSDHSVAFSREGHCADLALLQDKSLFELNPIRGALASTEDPDGLFRGEAADQDLLAACRSHALTSERRPSRNRRQVAGKELLVDSDTILPAMLAPDVAFARRVTDDLPASQPPPSSSESSEIELEVTVETTEFPPIGSERVDPVVELHLVGVDVSRADRLKNLMKQAMEAKEKLKFVLTELDRMDDNIHKPSNANLRSAY